MKSEIYFTIILLILFLTGFFIGLYWSDQSTIMKCNKYYDSNYHDCIINYYSSNSHSILSWLQNTSTTRQPNDNQ